MNSYWLHALAFDLALRSHIIIYEDGRFEEARIDNERCVHSNDEDDPEGVSLYYTMDDISIRFRWLSIIKDSEGEFMIHKCKTGEYIINTHRHGILVLKLW